MFFLHPCALVTCCLCREWKCIQQTRVLYTGLSDKYKNCSLHIMRTATNQKPQKLLKDDTTHHLIAWMSMRWWVVGLSSFYDFCGFSSAAVLTFCLNCSFLYLLLHFNYQILVLCYSTPCPETGFKLWQHFGRFWQNFHCACVETATCELPFKFLIPPLNLEIQISYKRELSIDQMCISCVFNVGKKTAVFLLPVRNVILGLRSFSMKHCSTNAILCFAHVSSFFSVNSLSTTSVNRNFSTWRGFSHKGSAAVPISWKCPNKKGEKSLNFAQFRV